MTDFSRPASRARSFLLLQGLMGPFFERIGAALRRRGHAVHKVNFNGGDAFYWRLPGAIAYRGTPADWPAALQRIVETHGITDLLLFGDSRPLHRAAIAACKALHVQVHVFEEGYLRPDWVTLELGGVNGHSALPRDPAWYRTRAAALPPAPEHRPVPSSFARRAREGIYYNSADILTRWYFRHWDNHRPWHPLVEGVGWLKRLSRRKAATGRAAELIAEVERAGTDYMLFPLQLDADAQVRLHSPFSGIGEAIEMVIASFAAHAPPALRLLIKEHPLDNGVRDWAEIIAAAAARHGVGDRVAYLQGGDIAVLVCAARGLVTINSTTGTLALAHEVPVICLGHAVYDIPDITYQGTLDGFWSTPGGLDPSTFAAFRRVLIERCLIEGGFFSDEGLDRLVEGAVSRLEASPMGRAAPVTQTAGPAARSVALSAREAS